jgi:hypothetical protein
MLMFKFWFLGGVNAKKLLKDKTVFNAPRSMSVDWNLVNC